MPSSVGDDHVVTRLARLFPDRRRTRGAVCSRSVDHHLQLGSPRAVPVGTPRPSDGTGRIILRRAGRLHYPKVGVAQARRRVLAIVDEQEVAVVALDTGEVLSVHRIEPDRSYWRDTRRSPGRWPGPGATS